MTIEAIMVFVYMIFFSKQIKFYNVKRTKTSLYLTWRNVKYMANLGMSSFIGEAAILFMMIVGNNMFMHFLQEDGVAAFSVCCYLFPLVFMFGNAIAQSQMPIISYNYGLKDWKRIGHTFRIGIIWSVFCGLLLTTWGLFFNEPVVALFLDTGSSAYEIATEGLPYFSISFLFITLNLVYITYFQSIEQARFANLFMLLRGIFFLIPIFIIIPLYLGEIGLWLSVPLSELITFLAIAIAHALKSKKEGEQPKTNVP
jgi:Na+-driven multidrug efflux pump